LPLVKKRAQKDGEDSAIREDLFCGWKERRGSGNAGRPKQENMKRAGCREKYSLSKKGRVIVRAETRMIEEKDLSHHTGEYIDHLEGREIRGELSSDRKKDFGEKRRAFRKEQRMDCLQRQGVPARRRACHPQNRKSE